MSKSKDLYNQIKKIESSISVYPRVLERLNNDVKYPIQYFKKTGFGNWSAIRMIAPIIEALSGGDNKRRNKILLEVGIEYPNLFWLMYRNGLLHNDNSPLSIEMNGKSIGWAFCWDSGVPARIFGNKHYMIDPEALYNKLKEWLEKKILEKEDIDIAETVLIRIDNKKESIYKKEFEELSK